MTNNYFKITDGPGKKTSEIIKEVRSKFGVWMYNEENVDQDFPAPTSETTRYFKKNIEADEETLNKSANEIDPNGTKGCTVREYILMQLSHFDETGEYLDSKGWTLCTSSRLPGGKVASGYWLPYYSGVSFHWHDSGRSYPYVGARLAVNPKNLDLVPSKDFSVDKEILKSHLGVIEGEIAFIQKLLK